MRNPLKFKFVSQNEKGDLFFLLAFLSFLPSCKSPDKLIGDSNVFADTDVQPSVEPSVEPSGEPSGEPPSLSSISDLLSTDISEGSVVSLTDIVVTSPSDDNGFFVGDQSGGPNSGIFVQADFEQKSAFDVSIGEMVDLVGTFLEVEGTVVPDSAGYDNTLSTLSISNVEDVAVTGESQTPVQAVPFEYSDPSDIETFEGVLVSIESPSVTILDDSESLVYLNNVLVLNNRYYEYSEMALLEGTVNEITGIIGYENGNYVLYPRSVDDIDYTYVQEPTPDLFFTEFFVGEPDEITCQPNFDWYIELHYSIDNSAPLSDTVYISNENTLQGYLRHSKIEINQTINPGDTFILSSSGVETCLMNLETSETVRSLELNSVSGMSGGSINQVENGSTFTLFLSEDDDSYSNADYEVIDTVHISVQFGINSFELLQGLGKEENDVINPDNGTWVESTTIALENISGNQLQNNNGTILHGTPGSLVFHPN